MSGSAGDVGKGAVGGAAAGAPLGPYGAAAGAVIGGSLAYLNGGESDAEKAQHAAELAKVAQDKQSAIALSNYRQTSRDQYHKLLVNRMTPYQAYSNRLAAGWGQGMSTAGLSAAENPVTLRDTGVGAAQGSDFTGWDEHSPGYFRGNSYDNVVHHDGIEDYLDGRGNTANGSVSPMGGFNYQDYSSPRTNGRPTSTFTQNQDYKPSMNAAAQDAADQVNLVRQSIASKPALPAGGGMATPSETQPGGGYSFFPRKP